MSVRVMSAVWELDLPQSQKLILLAFADHADDQGRCRPSVARVAWKSGYSKRQAKAIVRDLRRAGVLIEEHAGGGRGWATEYRIRPLKGAKLAPFNGSERVRPDSRKGAATQLKGAKSRTKRGSVLNESSESSGNPPQKNLFAAAQRGDPRYQPFFTFAFESFAANYQRKPLWGGKDQKNLKTLLKAHSIADLPFERLQICWRAFLDSTDQFILKQGGSLAYFCGNIDKFANGPVLAGPQRGGANGKDFNEAVATTVRGYTTNAGITH